jgi:hypothetical protein
MFRIKLSIAILFLAVITLFYVQNREAVSLKLLCSDVNNFCFYQTPSLPIAAWMLLFALAGTITSLLLQFFNALSRPSRKKLATDNYYADSSESYTPRERTSYSQDETSFRSRNTDEVRSPQRNYDEVFPRSNNVNTQTTNTYNPQHNPQPSDRVASGNGTATETTKKTSARDEKSDWDDGESDDWNLDEPPKQTNSSRESLERSIREEESKLESESTIYEKPQNPETVNRSGSVYSYKYKESGESKENKGENKTDRVYDANYRLINPPIQPPQQDRPSKQTNINEDDDDDWV